MNRSRKIILDILVQFDRNGTYPNLALKNQLRKIDNERDRKFISATVYGVIENIILLDYYISTVSSVKIKKINVVVLNILRMGLYQLMFMSIPESAACNTSVELAKTNGQYKSSGFVNAILRKLSLTYNTILLPPEDSDEYLSVKYSISIENLKVLIESLGKKQTVEYLEFIKNKNDNIYIAVNTLEISPDKLIDTLKAENIETENTEFDGLLKCKAFNIEHSEAFKSGLFHVIGFPSYITASALDVKENNVVYDMCAAPGGKTFAIAYQSNDSANITAFDIHKHKIENMKNDCNRLGLTSVSCIVNDSGTYNPSLADSADRVLCDVPCSGLGIISKKPDIKYKKTDYEELTAIQLKILKNGASYLKKGGRLVYSTCTLNMKENRYIVDAFLAKNDSFILSESKIYNDNCGDFLFMPNKKNCDGFYIAVLERIK